MLVARPEGQKTCILHIGLPKTGSTSIQVAFHANRETLLLHGIHYFSVEPNHSRQIRSAFIKHPEGYHMNIRLGLNAEESRRYAQQALDALEREIAGSDMPFFMISAETISFFKVDEFDRFWTFLRDRFDRIEIYGYLRSPVQLINAKVSEFLKQGEAVTDSRLRPQYKHLLAKYYQCDADLVSIKFFDRSLLKNGSAVDDLLHDISQGKVCFPVDRRTRKKDQNASLSVRGAGFLYTVNKRFPAIQDGKRNHDRPSGLNRVATRLRGEKLRLAKRLVAEILADQAPDIAWASQIVGRDINDLDGYEGNFDPETVPLDKHAIWVFVKAWFRALGK